MKLFLKSLATGVVTAKPPRTDQSAPIQGYPVVDPGRCRSCGNCAGICPTSALELVPPGEQPAAVEGSLAVPLPSGGYWKLTVTRCLGCGRCETACTQGALTGSGDFGQRETWAPSEGAAAGRPGRSLHLRHLDSGACNACDWEMVALTNPIYDLQRLGLDFVASPRHADGLMVTGPVTRNLEEAVMKTYQATPEPRLVIAVGTCACSGGLFSPGYASAGGVDRVLPVQVYIPGCPPTPQAMLQGLRQALRIYPGLSFNP